MKLFVTVDTEADDWDDFRPVSDGPCSNIRQLPRVHDLFVKCGVRPSYLVSHRIATDDEAASTLRDFLDSGTCEIGAHCHPWETPPYTESNSLANTMICNLPIELQRKKIRTLTECIEQSFGVRPVSFRAGRWGYDHNVAKVIRECGYRVDTSITPFVSWKADHGPDFTSVELKPYWENTAEVFPDKAPVDLIEVPASIGFLQKDFVAAHERHRTIAGSWLKYFRINGILYHLRMLNKVWLSPEVYSAYDMIELVKRLRDENFAYANMVFHSQTLTPGLTPFAKTKEESIRFYKRLESFLEFIAAEGISGSTLKDEFLPENEQDRRSLTGDSSAGSSSIAID